MDHLSHYMINGAPGSIFGLKDGGRMLHGVIPVVADNFPVISGLVEITPLGCTGMLGKVNLSL